jgi:hypothetical protein
VTCTSHCSACGSHFHSLESFDLHRAGDHATGRHCVNPDDCNRLAIATTEGVCRLVQGVDTVSPVTIYRSRRHAEDTDAVLRLRSAERQAEVSRGELDHAKAASGCARALAGAGA